MAELSIEQFGDIIVIHIVGIFNIDSLARVEPVWMAQVARCPRLIAINCLKLESLDSSAIGSIVKIFNQAMSRGIMLVFYDLNPLLRKLFQTAKLTRYFTVTTSSDFRSRYLPGPLGAAGEAFKSV